MRVTMYRQLLCFFPTPDGSFAAPRYAAISFQESRRSPDDAAASGFERPIAGLTISEISRHDRMGFFSAPMTVAFPAFHAVLAESGPPSSG